MRRVLMKFCSLCKINKQLVEFSVNRRNKTDGRQPKCKVCNRKRYKGNKEKIKARVSNHYKENRDEILKRRVDLRKRPEAKKKKAIQNSNYVSINKEKIREYHKKYRDDNREDLNIYYKRWHREGRTKKPTEECKPEFEAFYKHLGLKGEEHRRLKSLEYNHKRRARIKMNKENTLTAKQIRFLFDTQKICSYCGSDYKLELDHVIPVSNGGQNSINNIVIACKECNISKGNKKLIMWLAYKSKSI